MHSFGKYATAVVFMAVGLVFGVVLTTSCNLNSNGYGQESKKQDEKAMAEPAPGVPEEAVEFLSKTSQAMADVVASVKPAVVNISTTKKVKVPGFGGMNEELFKRFFGDEFLRKFFGGPHEQERESSSLGSGVIVDERGYVLTNYHVVKDAEEITVLLSDKREFKGEVKGSDPKSDLAVVKIEADNLPVATWGNSDSLRPGETIIAIGNPFGLNQTVTTGIVSATGRANVGIADYEDFIQTDAAINPGNSGGALVDVRGRLVGINTAIFSTTGGYQGIGFAIPASMARRVLDSIIEHGKVIRGWLGVWIQPVTRELAEQFGLDEARGVLISDVFEDSPAAEAGLRSGDIILKYGGKKVSSPTELRNAVAETTPGASVKVEVLRDGDRRTVDVGIGELPDEQAQGEDGGIQPTEGALSGVAVQELSPELKEANEIPERVQGVVVTGLDPRSAASEVLKPGDIIVEINREPVPTISEYRQAAREAGDNVLLKVFRGGRTIFLTLTP